MMAWFNMYFGIKDFIDYIKLFSSALKDNPSSISVLLSWPSVPLIFFPIPQKNSLTSTLPVAQTMLCGMKWATTCMAKIIINVSSSSSTLY